MKNADRWVPSKFVPRRGALRATRDPNALSPASYLLADAVARRYGDALPRYATGRLVDLGCGRVPLYGCYRAHVDSVTCVDWGHSVHGETHLDLICDLNQPLPFEDAAFETVILSDVLEHIAAPDALWRELSRVVSPGGHVLLNVPFMYWLHETPFDFYRYTEFALRQFAERNSFNVVSLDAVGGAPEVMLDIIAKHLLYIPGVGRWAAGTLQSVGASLGGLALWRRFWAKTERAFPLGYFVVVQRQTAYV